MKHGMKKVWIYPAVFLITCLVVWVGFIVTQSPHAVILMYHSIGDERSGMSAINVSVDAFQAQMTFLKKNGYRVVPLDDIVRSLREKRSIPPKTVAITFDDGYVDNYIQAFPVLKAYGFPATIFMITDLIGQERLMYGYTTRFLTGPMIREMDATGLITFGSHTSGHIYLPDIEDQPARLNAELVLSKRTLEVLLGHPVAFLCYPCGGYSPTIERAVKRAGYAAAVSTALKHKGFLYRDLYALKRVKMTNDVSPFVLFMKCNGYYLLMREMRL